MGVDHRSGPVCEGAGAPGARLDVLRAELGDCGLFGVSHTPVLEGREHLRTRRKYTESFFIYFVL